jgi:hypothetical protein
MTTWWCLILLVQIHLLSTPVSAAWQEISDYTDCGSTNFKTEKILVDFTDETYWLNISIQGQFAHQVVDYSTVTNLASINPPPYSLDSPTCCGSVC